MTIKWAVVDFEFDVQEWARVMSTIRRADRKDFAEIIGCDEATIDRWIGLQHAAEFPFPRMSNFINACNWLDMDPRSFFRLKA